MRTVQRLDLYDTTLRDGTQGEGVSLSVDDKLAVARIVDELGVGFIEGGWPGAVPKDTEFFRRARAELDLRNAELAAFGATRKPEAAVEDDAQVACLLNSGAPVVTLVAKSHERHVRLALRTSLDENLRMVADTVGYLVAHGRRVFVDCEHYFDGFRADETYARAVASAAAGAGADAVVLCDTNGGTLPGEIADTVSATAKTTAQRIGIHCHDDGGCAVANTIAAVDAGAGQVQVTANGYGERCGNANLFTVAANLVLKRHVPVLTPEQMASMRSAATRIGEIAGQPVSDVAPYVGRSSFAHKAGLHASAVRIDAAMYQHIDPAVVGNTMRTLVSDMSGRSSIALKAKELGYDLDADGETVSRLSERVKELESEGYGFESADASFAVMLADEIDGTDDADDFEVVSWRLTVEPLQNGDVAHVAFLEVSAGGRLIGHRGAAHGPVDALCIALRDGLARIHPVADIDLVDYRIRPLATLVHGRKRVKVQASFTDGASTWETVGVADSMIGASFAALCDGIRYTLLRPRVPNPGQPRPG